jgi:hypothetical protein
VKKGFHSKVWTLEQDKIAEMCSMLVVISAELESIKDMLARGKFLNGFIMKIILIPLCRKPCGRF